MRDGTTRDVRAVEHHLASWPPVLEEAARARERTAGKHAARESAAARPKAAARTARWPRPARTISRTAKQAAASAPRSARYQSVNASAASAAPASTAAPQRFAPADRLATKSASRESGIQPVPRRLRCPRAREAIERGESERERENDERVVGGEETRGAREESAGEAVRERQRVRIQRAALRRPEPIGLPQGASGPEDAVDVVEVPEVLPRVPTADDGMGPGGPRPAEQERQRGAGESGEKRLAPEAERERGPLDRHGATILPHPLPSGHDAGPKKSAGARQRARDRLERRRRVVLQARRSPTAVPVRRVPGRAGPPRPPHEAARAAAHRRVVSGARHEPRGRLCAPDPLGGRPRGRPLHVREAARVDRESARASAARDRVPAPAGPLRRQGFFSSALRAAFDSSGACFPFMTPR